jgi:cytosine deaminase
MNVRQSVRASEGVESMDKFIKAAIEEAREGRREGGIPIGSVLVKGGRIIGRGHNQRVQKKDPILHAEIDCLRNAGRVGSYAGTTLYSTLMPCFLCAGAIVQFKIKRVVAGESATFEGAREFLQSHGVEVIDLGLDECKQMMRAFIEERPQLWFEDIGEL